MSLLPTLPLNILCHPQVPCSPPTLKQATQGCYLKYNLFPFSRTSITQEEIHGNKSQTAHCPVTALCLLVENLFCAGAIDPTLPTRQTLTFFHRDTDLIQQVLERIYTHFFGGREGNKICLVYPPKIKLHINMQLHFIKQLRFFYVFVRHSANMKNYLSVKLLKKKKWHQLTRPNTKLT